MPDPMATAFNEWMRRYTEEPERFEQEWTTIRRFLKDAEAGEEPAYGVNCAAYLRSIMEEAAAKS